MQVVYYVRPGENNPELRYSLRSLANLSHDRVWLVGYKPEWVTGVEHIPASPTGSPQRNAVDQLAMACDALTAERFVIFNDDFYVMDPVLAIPSYHAGPLVSGPGPVRLALRRLREMGYDSPLAWTLHIPVVVWRRKLADILATLTGRQVPEWRTMYGNLSGATGERAPDVKVRSRSDRIPSGPFLSSSDATFPLLRRMLAARFPMPSPYEVPA